MRNVLVTGASRGLGLAITTRLAADGYRVIAAARTPPPEPAQTAPGEIVFQPCDLSQTATLGPVVKSLRTRFGPLYGLVNNAAGADAGILATTPEPRIARLVELNVLSPLILTKHVARSMMAGRGGRIVNIASVVATTGYAGLSVYSATKAALLGFTRALARELGPLDITVNAVSPGFIATEMTAGLAETDRARIVRRSPLARAPEPEDVAAAVAYLFSDAARNITGTELTVDAGNTA